MRVETTGLVKMKDDPGRGTPVSVVLDGDRLSIDLGNHGCESPPQRVEPCRAVLD